MQILEIVIYSKDGHKRTINLNYGKVNIITGKSTTGKSALYGGTKSQDSFRAKIRQNSTVRKTRGYPFRYTCAGVWYSSA